VGERARGKRVAVKKILHWPLGWKDIPPTHWHEDDEWTCSSGAAKAGRKGTMTIMMGQAIRTRAAMGSTTGGTLGGMAGAAALPSVAIVLVIDRQPAELVEQLREPVRLAGGRIETAVTGAAGLERMAQRAPALVFLDAELTDRDALELQKQIRTQYPKVPVVFTSAAHTADKAIKGMKQGAFDYLFKPIEAEHLGRAVSSALAVAGAARGTERVAELPKEPELHGSMCGSCSAMREVYKSIGLVAGQHVNVLITGESGTGKELVARAIHDHSIRAREPFLALNCAAIPEHLLESELFGYEKGAFSGADRRRIGKFEQCNGGTLLLDEIGDMPRALQAKILRVIQEQAFERVGGSETIRTNVRILAATHRDLKAWSAEGHFRADLYYRLGVFNIHLPALRERTGDLPMLVRHFLTRYSTEMGREAKSIAADALEMMERYAWPGNVRELQSVIKQALLRASGPVLLRSFLPVLAAAARTGAATGWDKSQGGMGFEIDGFLRERLRSDARDLYADIHREVDRYALARVMTYTRGNRYVAARLLGIARQTLRMKTRECGLQITQSVEMGECEPTVRERASMSARSVLVPGGMPR
jgi:DNA-binding NtrC family response regulator